MPGMLILMLLFTLPLIVLGGTGTPQTRASVVQARALFRKHNRPGRRLRPQAPSSRP
jgi:hypothetical protein